MMLVDQLRRLTTNKPRTQLLLCGDFNSLPDSGVIEYLENGRIDVKHKDFLNLAYKKSLCKMISHSPDEEMYNHQFQVSGLFKMSLQISKVLPQLSPLGSYLPLVSAFQ